MAAADFDDCYAQICDLLSLEAVPLAPDEDGGRAFTVTYNDADFSFFERKQRDGSEVSMLVRFGAPPTEIAEKVLASLMRSSYQMMESGGAFVMAPETGEIYLHRLIALSGLHVGGLQPAFEQLSQLVERWSRDYCLDPEIQPTSGQLDLAALA